MFGMGMRPGMRPGMGTGMGQGMRPGMNMGGMGPGGMLGNRPMGNGMGKSYTKPKPENYHTYIQGCIQEWGKDQFIKTMEMMVRP